MRRDQSIESPIPGPFEVVTDSKLATTLITLGATCHKIDILYNDEYPRIPTLQVEFKEKDFDRLVSLLKGSGFTKIRRIRRGGTGRFFFASDPTCPISKTHAAWDSSDGEKEFESEIEKAKADPSLSAFVKKLELLLQDALISKFRATLRNFQRINKYFGGEAEEFTIVDGEFRHFPRKDEIP